MEKEKFLKSVAEHGYNVYFGAKKHFATYDIVEKVPGWIALITLCIGIWQIYAPTFTYSKEVSLIIILASVIALQINHYAANKEHYKDNGNELIKIHNDLKKLYLQVQSSSNPTVTQAHQDTLQELLNRYYAISIPKQIFLSDWYAHYKFFCQSQYEWINEQKKFTWKDKIPFSARLFLGILLLIFAILIISFL